MKITLVYIHSVDKIQEIIELISFLKTSLPNFKINLLILGKENIDALKKEINGVDFVNCLPLSWENFHNEKTLNALKDYHEKSSNNYYVFTGSLAGKELAPRFAQRICGATATEVTDLKYSKDIFQIKRGSFGQNLISVFETKELPLVISIAKGTEIKNNPPDLKNDFEIINLEKFIDNKNYEKSYNIKSEESNPLLTSDKVFVGGRGLGREGFSSLVDLGKKYKIPVGATRPVVLTGLAPFKKMIGQSGIVVMAKTVITFGVSGSAAFLVGIKSAEKVISINTDKSAPIFSAADIGIVYDANEIIKILLEN